MKLRYTLLAALIVLAIGIFDTSQAQNSGGADAGLFSMTAVEEFGDGALGFVCSDAQDNYDNPAEIRETFLSVFDTDTALICIVEAFWADTYFFPTSISYVVDNHSYSIGYDQFYEIEGEAGQLIADTNVTIVLAFPQVERGEPFTFIYEGGTMEVDLGPWR